MLTKNFMELKNSISKNEAREEVDSSYNIPSIISSLEDVGFSIKRIDEGTTELRCLVNDSGIIRRVERILWEWARRNGMNGCNSLGMNDGGVIIGSSYVAPVIEFSNSNYGSKSLLTACIYYPGTVENRLSVDSIRSHGRRLQGSL